MVFDHLRQGSFSVAGTLLRPVIGPLWSLYKTVSGLLVVAVGFALLLQAYAIAQRPAIVVDGPPRSASFEYREGRNARPTLRVPVGGKIVFDLPWHVRDGGCERVVTRTFTRGEPGYDEYALSQQMVGKVYPVGRPGLDHIERDLPMGIAPGIWLYRASGEVRNCPTPRKAEPLVYAEFWVEVYDPDGPVSIEVGRPVLRSNPVVLGKPLIYRESFTRTEDVPSETLFTYTEVGGKQAIVLDRRPVAYSQAGEFRDVDVTQPLPPGVHPGRWRLRKTTISTRPGGRTRIDPMFEIEFEVAG
jgi:hypothetical protein